MIFTSLALPWNTLSADDEYLIDTDEKVKEITGYNWECEWKGTYNSGTSTLVYDEGATLKKVTAKVKNSSCPNGWGKYVGKYKKGKGTGKTSKLPSPCEGLTTGSGMVYKATDGSLYSKGNWRHSSGYSSGTNYCKAVSK